MHAGFSIMEGGRTKSKVEKENKASENIYV